MNKARKPFFPTRATSKKQCLFSRAAERWTVVIAVAIGALFTTTSYGGLGDPLVAKGGDIVMRFEGTSANFDSLISVNNVEVNGQSLFFPNHATQIGSTIDLGPFLAGMPLDITLHVITPTASNTWHTGAGSLNSDNVIHANVTYNYNGDIGRTFVGFEDQVGGGDLDYNDHMFSFTGVITTIPEPGICSLMIAGMGALVFGLRCRKIKQN
jgi:hypothetical protein